MLILEVDVVPVCQEQTLLNSLLFSWDNCMSQEKFKTVLTQNFGRQTRCIMGDVKVANGEFM